MIGNSLIISLIVLFIYICFGEKEIFGWLSKWFKTWVPKQLWKPLFDCNVCMSPWYGTVVYFFLSPRGGIVSFILTLFTAGGISCIFAFIHEIAQNTKKKE